MRAIGIITKHSETKALEATRHLAQWLHAQGRQVTITERTAQDVSIPASVARVCPQETLAQGQDLIIVLGGDGTFIAAGRALGDSSAPLLGVNMGHLGFLTEIADNTLTATLLDIFEGKYRLEQRMLLDASVFRHGQQVLQSRVINDVVAHKGKLARMMEYEVYLDEQFVFSSRADGLIVATPTGSTAYALSAGGPIIHPSLEAILLVPICPHTLNNRPILVPGEGEISFKLASRAADQQLTLDGQSGFALTPEDLVVIRRSAHRLRVIHPLDRNYYDVLRGKLRWAEHAGH
ncbi:MAG: NAD(+) kinase [Magnetococcus sp. WYHC-3]